MQPVTDIKFDKPHFDRIKRTIRNMAVGKRESLKHNFQFFTIPDEVGIQLTNKCNLRCKTCFQWNEDGFFNTYSKEEKNEEIAIGVIQHILQATKKQHSNLYLWGGEPFCYSNWDTLASLLDADPRWTVLCTNGVSLDKHIHSIIKISKTLALLISLDGFKDENNAIRGNGVYEKVMHNIDLLLHLKNDGYYHGEISVNCVINESMVGKFYDFALLMEQKGINSLYFCFPWYLPPKTSTRMDTFFNENFFWLTNSVCQSPSWHAYKYRFDPEKHDQLINDLKMINNKNWNIRIRYQPALEFDEITDFLNGDEIPGQHRSKCIGLFNRLNVLPNGKVTVCKMFPEFEIGDLNNETVYNVWNGEKMNRVREILNNGLMPVCSKCILLYLHGV